MSTIHSFRVLIAGTAFLALTGLPFPTCLADPSTGLQQDQQPTPQEPKPEPKEPPGPGGGEPGGPRRGVFDASADASAAPRFNGKVMSRSHTKLVVSDATGTEAVSAGSGTAGSTSVARDIGAARGAAGTAKAGTVRSFVLNDKTIIEGKLDKDARVVVFYHEEKDQKIADRVYVRERIPAKPKEAQRPETKKPNY